MLAPPDSGLMQIAERTGGRSIERITTRRLVRLTILYSGALTLTVRKPWTSRDTRFASQEER